MAKISSSFNCMICKNPLNFPNDIDITDFIIVLLQFYKTHEACEKAPAQITSKKEISMKKTKRKKKGD